MKRKLILLLPLPGCGFQGEVSQEIKDICKAAKDFDGCLKIQLKSKNNWTTKSNVEAHSLINSKSFGGWRNYREML